MDLWKIFIRLKSQLDEAEQPITECQIRTKPEGIVWSHQLCSLGAEGEELPTPRKL